MDSTNTNTTTDVSMTQIPPSTNSESGNISSESAVPCTSEQDLRLCTPVESSAVVPEVVSTALESNLPTPVSVASVSSDFSDALMSPGGRSDVTIAYEDPDAPSPMNVTPTIFQSPQGTPRRSKGKDDVPVRTVNSASTDSERPGVLIGEERDDPVHPPTPCRTNEPEESEVEECDRLLESVNIFAQKEDPVHLPSPQSSRTGSPVSLVSSDADRNELSPLKSNVRPSTLMAPPPSPFSALTSSTPSPDTLAPAMLEVRTEEEESLLSCARKRIDEDFERLVKPLCM